MTMWSTNFKRALPCLHLAGQMGTALSRQVSICCLQPLKATVIMKFRIALTTGQTSSAGNIFGSLVVTTKTGIPVKIVFVRNRNKKSECLYLLSTDTSLNNAEIVRIYGNRWSIECFFKASKSFLKLSSEFQSRSYGAMVSHTTIVFTRYIILEWIRRNQNDQKRLHEEKSVMS